jgi:hypothetical protein
LFIGSGCSSNKVKIKHEFLTSDEEIRKAKSQLRSSKNETLYLLMVDKSGKVVKVKLLDFKERKLEERGAIRFKSKIYQFEFYPAKVGEPEFREFIYPLDMASTVEFL